MDVSRTGVIVGLVHLQGQPYYSQKSTDKSDWMFARGLQLPVSKEDNYHFP